jgi:hypothetical protein
MLSDSNPSVKDWPKTWKRARIVRAAGGWRRVGPARAGVYKKSGPSEATHPHAPKDQACSSLDIDRQRWGQDYPYEKRGQARSARLPSLDGLLRIILPPSFRGSIETRRRKVTPGGRLSATRREEETDARLAGAMRSGERPFPGLVPRASSWRSAETGPPLGTLSASECTMRRSRASSADVTAYSRSPAASRPSCWLLKLRNFRILRSRTSAIHAAGWSRATPLSRPRAKARPKTSTRPSRSRNS